MVFFWLIAGGALLAVFLGVGKVFVSTSPQRLAVILRWTAAIPLAGLSIALLVGERVMPALVVGMAALWLVGRLPPGALRLLGLPTGGLIGGLGGQPSAGQSSTIESSHLRMTLDHDSGTFAGTVLAGKFRGRILAELDRAELMDLLGELRVDDERGATLLEAWLDRIVGADWREADPAASSSTPPPPRADAAMTVDEAYSILGLAPGADSDAIREAHRRLMRHTHPDAGGSAWLAARVNAAKDLLLKPQSRE